MLATTNANTKLGANRLVQGSVIAVVGTGVGTLRGLWAAYARGLFWGLGTCLALILKRGHAGMTPRPAMCWTNCSTQRHVAAATMSGVVVDPGTVGVRW